MVEIACIGEAMIELSLEGGESGDAARLGVAGDTLNTAIYLKRAMPAANVAYVTRLGTDPFSARMRDFMAGEGLDTGLIGESADRLPGLYAISTDDEGERSFTYWRDNSAARGLFADGAPGLGDLMRFDVVFFSAITLAILSDQARADLIAWLPDFRANGGRVAFDSNWRPRLWPDPVAARDVIGAIWAQTDIAMAGIEDESAIFGDSGADQIIERLRGFGIAHGALKCGAEGPRPVEEGVALPDFPQAARVIDSTAAGDSFNGAYLAACLDGRAPADCLVAGHAMAVRVLGHKGAIIPRDAEC